MQLSHTDLIMWDYNNKMNNILNELDMYKGEDVFNPYREKCSKNDNKHSPDIRFENLYNILFSFNMQGADSIWLGRDLSYNGGRRTGIAFTDEFNLDNASNLWKTKVIKATSTDRVRVQEKSATLIWKKLMQFNHEGKLGRVFLWNVFPMHPYNKDKPFSNRSHTKKEREFGTKIFDMLLDYISPGRVVCVGNDAYDFAKNFTNKVESIVKVRHPAYGGEKILASQLDELYQVGQQTMQPLL